MSTLIHRDYAGDADRDAVMALWLTVREAGLGDPWPTLDTLQAALAAQPHGMRYAQLWEDHQGCPVGMAMLLDESVLVWCTKAGADDETLEADIVTWGLNRAAYAAHSSGERPTLFVPVHSDDEHLASLAERMGFREDTWRTLRMERSLHAPIAAPQLPHGVDIRPVTDARDTAGVTTLHSTLFAGGRKTVGEHMAAMHTKGYRPALDLVATLANGTVVGYGFGTCCALERQLLGQATGWIEFVGVDHAQRGGGIGRALTLQLLHALWAEGLDSVWLTTGAANTAARCLFEGCGFHTRHEIRWFVQEAD